MKVLGIDWGEKRIGLALAGDSFAEPYGVVASFEELSRVIEREGIRQVVLGIPEGKHERRVREFGKRIETKFGIPVMLRTEVLTSRMTLEKMIEAGRSKKDRRELDAAAAALLLQEYLNSGSAQ